LLEKQGDILRARAAYQRVVDPDHPEYLPLGREALDKMAGDTG
jgi:hypothetical protein